MQFKTNKDKGEYYEKLSRDWWAQQMGVQVRQMPGSGRFVGLAGDLMFRDGILKEFVVDVKAEQGILSKRGLELYDKMKKDSNLKKSFLEVYADGYEPLVVMSRNDLKKILYELQGFQNENV